jgi:hypothetical protein
MYNIAMLPIDFKVKPWLLTIKFTSIRLYALNHSRKVKFVKKNCCKSKRFLNSRYLELFFVEKLAFFIALKSQLKQLSKKFPIIVDVRGQGLFLGI